MKKFILCVALMALEASVVASAPAQPTAQTVTKSLNLLLTNVITEFAGFSKEDAEIEAILQKAKALAEKNDLKGSFATIDSIDGVLKKAGMIVKTYNFKVDGKEYATSLTDMLNRTKQGLVPYAN